MTTAGLAMTTAGLAMTGLATTGRVLAMTYSGLAMTGLSMMAGRLIVTGDSLEIKGSGLVMMEIPRDRAALRNRKPPALARLAGIKVIYLLIVDGKPK
jgi:hypothetical protein